MYNHTLINKHIFASIGEPWDFESSEGKNCLKGKITAVSEINDLILCEVSKFLVSNFEINQIVVINRYKREQSIVDDLSKNKRVGVNMFYSNNGELITPENMINYLENKENKNFLVGSIQLS